MFLKRLMVHRDSEIIRDVSFRKGVNLIVDETKTTSNKESGNNVGKTTVLRAIDYCLGGSGTNIYKDTEFKGETNHAIEKFLSENNVVVSLTLKSDLDDESSNEIEIRRNFLKRSNKVQEINGENVTNKDFNPKLKWLIFGSSSDKPTFRQIISKNVRDEKDRLENVVRVLHSTTKQEEYEALYLFWFGLDVTDADRKQRLLSQRKVEENLQTRLKKDATLSQVNQLLLVVDRNIEELEQKRKKLNINERYEEEVDELNKVKSAINTTGTLLSRLSLRESLIKESSDELDNEISNIDIDKIRALYEEAESLIPDLQKTFEETVTFHNQMIHEKKKYIANELPSLKERIGEEKEKLRGLREKEDELTEKLRKSSGIGDLEEVVYELNSYYERKGNLEEQKRVWEDTLDRLKRIDVEIEEINAGIASLDKKITEKISEFNKYFSEMSRRLYGEQFVLNPEKTEKGYDLRIGSVSGNPGTGKKKGQIAAFDLAYIQFADMNQVDCLHFVLHDQVENVHDNQITNLFADIVENMNCQYVAPVLVDKLPGDVDVEKYKILSLSQDDKFFRI